PWGGASASCSWRRGGREASRAAPVRASSPGSSGRGSAGRSSRAGRSRTRRTGSCRHRGPSRDPRRGRARPIPRALRSRSSRCKPSPRARPQRSLPRWRRREARERVSGAPSAAARLRRGAGGGDSQASRPFSRPVVHFIPLGKPEAMAVRTGLLPDRYTGAQPIGRGGMGEIFRATDTTLGRAVAIKLLDPRYGEDTSVRERFTREALAVARLSGNAHIVTIYDVGEWRGRPFIVMEYLGGGSLQDTI